MNANEVLATLASERLGAPVHPNDHVNASSRRNDVFPSAIHIAGDRAPSSHDLIPALRHLADALERKAVRVRRRREVRPHAPDGRDAGHARPGVRRLRGRRSGYGVERLESSLPRVGRAAARRHRRRHRASTPRRASPPR